MEGEVEGGVAAAIGNDRNHLTIIGTHPVSQQISLDTHKYLFELRRRSTLIARSSTRTLHTLHKCSRYPRLNRNPCLPTHLGSVTHYEWLDL